MIWGIGPSLTIPTATDKEIGTQKWSAGPAAVALAQPGPWVVGSLVRQLWSFAGDGDRQDVSQLLIQPFVNYNMKDGWYLVSSPIITANWEADSDNRWVVPLGGGGGRVFKIGPQPVNATLQAYYNVEKPEFGPDWSLRFAISFLFPKYGHRPCRESRFSCAASHLSGASGAAYARHADGCRKGETRLRSPHRGARDQRRAG